MCQTGLKPVRNSPLSQPSPYGYPMRFGVRSAGAKGFKIYGADPKQPFRYIEWHSHRQILHEGAHKKANSPPLVSISSNWRSKSTFPAKDDAAAFTITVHSNKTPNTNSNSTNDTPPLNPTPDEPSTSAPPPPDTDTNTTIALDHTRCRPVTFEFTLPIPTPDGTSTPETFAWRRAAPACRETRGLRKKTLPMIETGDERPPEETFVYGPSGSVLVRLAGGGGARVPPGKDTPLGFTRQGEEIVASYTNSRDGTAWYYFQFWGAGARGALGRVWTDVAVMSGMAVWQDENQEAARRQMAGSHGVVSVMPSIPGRRGQWPGARHGRAGALWSEAIPGSVVTVPGVMQMPLPPVAVEEVPGPEDRTEP